MGGSAVGPGRKESPGLASFSEVVRMLQWRPKLIVLVAVVVVVAAILGQFTWESIGADTFEQFTW
jgi:uncharacterized protein involved in exopolysaccharide biosynthesis